MAEISNDIRMEIYNCISIAHIPLLNYFDTKKLIERNGTDDIIFLKSYGPITAKHHNMHKIRLKFMHFYNIGKISRYTYECSLYFKPNIFIDIVNNNLMPYKKTTIVGQFILTDYRKFDLSISSYTPHNSFNTNKTQIIPPIFNYLQFWYIPYNVWILLNKKNINGFARFVESILDNNSASCYSINANVKYIPSAILQRARIIDLKDYSGVDFDYIFSNLAAGVTAIITWKQADKILYDKSLSRLNHITLKIIPCDVLFS